MGFFDTLKSMFSEEPEEAVDPVTEWIRAALAIITGDPENEPGGWPVDDARETLSEWWDVQNADDVRDTLERLAEGDGAWDLLRGVHVTRMASAAGYLAPDDGLDHAIHFAHQLMQRFDSWQALALEYWHAHREWAAGQGMTAPTEAERQAQMGRLHFEAWQSVPFRQRLGATSAA